MRVDHKTNVGVVAGVSCPPRRKLDLTIRGPISNRWILGSADGIQHSVRSTQIEVMRKCKDRISVTGTPGLIFIGVVVQSAGTHEALTSGIRCGSLEQKDVR
jgi:hypothetical protein